MASGSGKQFRRHHLHSHPTHPRPLTPNPQHNYHQRKHQIFAQGRNSFARVSGKWLMQVLFTNLHTCIHGSEVTGFFKIEPPTPEEYLLSANTGVHLHTARAHGL